MALKFSGSTIFENLNWTFEEPCWTALMGPSGSGKTSLIHMIAGLEKPTSGEVLVLGRSLASLNDRELSVHRQTVVGMAFQSFHLQSDRTALENMLLPLYFSDGDFSAGRQRAEQLCAALDLSAHLKSPVRQLSGGQRQRLALARALMNRPRILLADEPIGNLDAENAGRVLQLLRSERERGMNLLVVTHDDFLLHGVDQVLHLENGVLA
ncbi:ABC transporter ATP-binding protein [bacterium]|nr:ABC transporter ATP-binding protein [bacterium]